MAAKVAGCCEGLVSSIDEVPTISEIMHKAIIDHTFPGGTVAFGSCTVPCYYQGVPPVNISPLWKFVRFNNGPSKSYCKQAKLVFCALSRYLTC